ncbi:PDZ and LIM domain protein 7-like [Sarcoramphus papa]
MGQPLTIVPPFVLMPQACPWVQLGHGGAAVSAGVWQGGRHVQGHLWEGFPVPKQDSCVVLAERLPSVTRRQPPQLLEPPSTPVCDPGKLQLIEDAEDWQPRTGTSQSRSFRKLARLMGTDGMEDRDDVFVKKPR